METGVSTAFDVSATSAVPVTAPTVRYVRNIAFGTNVNLSLFRAVLATKLRYLPKQHYPVVFLMEPGCVFCEVGPVLGAFAKLRKATIIFVMCACPSVRSSVKFH